MEEDVGGSRPNIRVEIHNNLVNSMEVDEERASEGEEGEISDSNELEDVNQDITFLTRPNAKMVIPDSGFSTGIDIFDKAEQEKRSGRAKRFALDPKEINNFTEEHLQELHNSLDINAGNEGDVKFESLHIHGVEDMSTEDVLEYFGKYAPSTIEWITEDNCNVVWTDKVSAARALFYLSKAIQGIMEEKDSSKDEDEGRSVLLKSKNREVMIQAEKENGSDVHISQIADPLPAGFWRLGVPHHKSKCILMRFSVKSDAKPVRAEKFVNYYNKSKKVARVPKKAMFKGIFDRNQESGGGDGEEDNKNPWGSLARNWYEDIKYAEQDYKPPVQEEVKVKSVALQNRLGYKRAAVQEEDKDEEEVQEKKSKVPRMRMYADEEEERIKRRQQLNALKKVNTEQKTDLRSILGITKKKPPPPQQQLPVEEQIDLGTKLKNRKSRIPQQHSDVRGRLEERSSLKSRLYTRPKSPKRRGRASDHVSEYEEDYDDQKTGSKVAVVIKKQKAPAVASTVWSRINEKERLKTVSEGKLRVRRDSSSSASSSSSSSTFYSEDTNEESVDEPMATLEEENVPASVVAAGGGDEGAPRKGIFERPGFKNNVSLQFKPGDHKSPLRIEINNDHFKRK
ncbi:PREDICTED: nuclear cap-binding protein subunit 3-like [Nicrophorus vespilloides]|uniref:Nuclear cap-binding protein subunit 3 n=1 Tax=Nicrophorus vespilloides TaxID=110193 RepID=A0ABM1MDK0_NICVS|nr:PREDICTED: nuclear cap-binding protein subunit 3-like [Nicrophorus vespilloides]